ncbi:MAG: hypothetical protein FJW30_28305 [Acidobacteria bacterium]|nr:hypothetical protein [Acidobacteriota bacterium]
MPIGPTACDHPGLESFPVHIATATKTEKNVLKMELVPVACWRLDDVRFQFGGSFVLPETAADFTELAGLSSRHAGAPLSVFGHADPVGDEYYNKTLSARRAEAVYAILTRDTARWESIYSNAGSGDNWGEECIRIMLTALGYEPGTDWAPYTEAVKQFQRANGLSDDGAPGAQTRAKLFPAYMDAICRRADGQPFFLTKQQFLGQGADAAGKGDFQGCSEFNPVMVFSSAELSALSADPEKRNAENSVNRRVVVLLFRPGTTVPASRWPCGTAAESTTPCRKRFWSDAANRVANQSARREFGKTYDTFGCRFYQRLVGDSPCEGVAKPGYFRLQIIDDETGEPLPEIELRVTLSSGVVQEMVSDAAGKIYIASAPAGVCAVTSDFAEVTVEDTYDYISLG